MNPLFANRLGTTRNKDIDTAHDAARRNAKANGTQRQRVLGVLIAAGDDGCTDYEISIALNIQRTSAGKRRLELMESGAVESTGERRRTDTNSTAVVWRTTDYGRELHDDVLELMS